MRISLKIQQLIFGENGLMFVVQRRSSDEYFYCSVAELFSNDNLLNEFSRADVRLISYFAAIEEQESDRAFLKNINISQQ